MVETYRTEQNRPMNELMIGFRSKKRKLLGVKNEINEKYAK